jgi:hypothetical protein
VTRDSFGTVRRCIVGDDDLQLRIGLCDERGERLGQKGLTVVDRDSDGYEWIGPGDFARG